MIVLGEEEGLEYEMCGWDILGANVGVRVQIQMLPSVVVPG